MPKVETLHYTVVQGRLQCYNQFIFGRQAMQMLTDVTSQKNFSARNEVRPRMQSLTDPNGRFIPTSQTSNDSHFHQCSLLLQQSQSCINIVNMVSSDKWQHTGHVTALLCLQTMFFSQRTGFGKSKTYFGGANHCPYMMGLGQGNRAAPPSWIQLSMVLVNVFKQLKLKALLLNPITLEMIHTLVGTICG
jgi:hypothetical protein